MRRRRGGALRRGAGPALLLVALAAAPLRAAFATVAELRRRLRERSLPVSGRKGELVARLRQGAGAARTPRPAAREAPLGPRAAGAGAAAAHERNKDDLGGLAVAELQARLRSRGLPVSGRKPSWSRGCGRRGRRTWAGWPWPSSRRGCAVAGCPCRGGSRAGREAAGGGRRGRHGGGDREGVAGSRPGGLGRREGVVVEGGVAARDSDREEPGRHLHRDVAAGRDHHNCSRGRMKRLKSEGFPVADLAPGQEVTGKVTSVQNYGVFVDVGAERDGLVHTSKLAEAAAGRVHKDVAVGDEVSAWVSQVRADGSLELTAIEGTAPSPRRALKVQSLEVGQKFEGVVVNVVQFGAFVDIGAERNGLVPREQTGAPPEDVQAAAAEGRPVAVWVTKVWPDDNFELTMKAHVGRSVAARPAARPAGGLEPGERLSGVVRAVMPYGFFVDVGSERDGLVPLSRMPAGEAVPQPGQEVAVWVRGVRPDGAIELTTDPRR
ncbi:unnamed protein product [Prorocentrum cordatum]|uniref:30S ribosomal protein S1 n=1 Tax=Prorocentrum cordatum TaxID=2364126 RepID=A0ABN9S9E0_9DINO|nr:unnamed protein product [Polarella glacialis]